MHPTQKGRRGRAALAILAVAAAAGCSNGSSGAENDPVATTGQTATVQTTTVQTSTVQSTASPSPGAQESSSSTAPSAADDQQQTSTTDEATGFRSVGTAFFTLSLPVQWSAYLLGEEGTVDPIAPAGPLADDVIAIPTASALQGGALYAVSSADHADADYVIVTQLGGGGTADETEAPSTGDVSASLRDHLAALGVADVVVDTVDVNGVTASRATYRYVPDDSGLNETEGVSVLVPGENGTDWLVTISSALPVDSAAIDKMVGSFALL